MAKKHCPHCGASMVEYLRTFNIRHARMLVKMGRLGGINVDVGGMGLNNSEYSAFAKIRLWGITEQDTNFDNKGKGGIWSITTKGWNFLKGNLSIPHQLTTYRNRVIKQSEKLVQIQDVAEGWAYRPQVIAESRPHTPTEPRA